MKAAEDKSVAVASTTGFVKKTPITITTPQQLAANQVKNKVHPVLVASDYKPVSSEAKVEVKKEVVTAPEVSKISVEATPSSLPPSPAPEQAKAAESAEVKVPPPAAADAFAVKQDMLSVRMAGEQKPKSRSGSPASVASPAVAGLGVQGSPSGSDLSMKAELLADKLGMKQQSSLTSATAVLPGMLPGKHSRSHHGIATPSVAVKKKLHVLFSRSRAYRWTSHLSVCPWLHTQHVCSAFF